MATDRTFYGGEGPSGGEISRVPYEGPGLGDFGPWKCPACGVENLGELSAGCTSCGSGKQAARKVETTTPQARPLLPPLTTLDDPTMLGGAIHVADAWAQSHPTATLAEAFRAGMAFVQQQTLTAPPITTDVVALAPEGKPRRTIIAALEYFRDQILPQATDEVASGEWCSVEEIETILGELKREEGLL